MLPKARHSNRGALSPYPILGRGGGVDCEDLCVVTTNICFVPPLALSCSLMGGKNAAAFTEIKGLFLLIPQPLGVTDAAEGGVLGETLEGGGVGVGKGF